MENNKTTREAEALAEGISLSVFHRRWLILGFLCLSLLVVMLANSVLTLALPTIGQDLQSTTVELNWIIAAYPLVFTGLLFASGALGDKYGRKKTLQAGLTIFSVACLYAAFIADTSFELILVRIVMGIGGAMSMPATLSILNTTFPISQRPLAITIWSAVSGVGVLLGTLLSGIMLSKFSWSSIFLLCLAIAVIALLGNSLFAPESKNASYANFDVIGAVLSFTCLSSFTYAILQLANPTLPSLLISLLFAITVVTGSGFVYWEKKSRNPILNIRLFKNKTFTIAVIVITLAFFAVNGILFMMSQLFQDILGYSPLEAALRTFPILIPVLVVAIAVPKIIAMIGEVKVLAIGTVALSIGFFLGALWSDDRSYLLIWIAAVIIIGGVVISSIPATNLILSSVKKKDSGMASAVNDATRELGSTLGIAILGSIVAFRYSSLAEINGYQEYSQKAISTVNNLAGPAAGDLQMFWLEGLQTAMLFSGCASLLASAFVLINLRQKNT